MKYNVRPKSIYLASAMVALSVGTALAQYDPTPGPSPSPDVGPSPSPTPLQCPRPSPTPAAFGTPTPVADVTVSMANLRFSPDPIRIRVGQTVTWTNTSSAPHTVTDDPCDPQGQEYSALPPGAEPFDSGTLQPGASFTQTFKTPGEYKYFCKFHAEAGMVGTIIVTQ